MVREVDQRVPGALPWTAAPETRRGEQPARAGEGAFAKLLQERLAARPAGGLQFSRHALERLEASGRLLSPGQVRALEEAVARAAAKGARESLVLLDDLALVVSVQNRTVITVVSGERMREQVFTQIDSAVIARQY